LLEMVRGALKQNAGCAYANGVFVAAEGLDLKTRGYCYWWEIFASGNLSFVKRILVGWLSGVELRSVGIALADGLCDLGGKSLQLKASMIGEGGPCPFSIIPWNLPFN
jgi:hypothetical protein